MSDAFMLQLRDAVEKKLRVLNENRERFVEAFLAETGYLPSEVVMVQKDEGGKTRIWFERKTEAENLYKKERAAMTDTPKPDDLVARLRVESHCSVGALSELLREAADEIEHLQSILAYHKGRVKETSAWLDQARREAAEWKARAEAAEKVCAVLETHVQGDTLVSDLHNTLTDWRIVRGDKP